MSMLLLTLFVSLVLMVVGIFFFGYSFRQGDYEHTDALSLLPIQENKNEAGSDNV